MKKASLIIASIAVAIFAATVVSCQKDIIENPQVNNLRYSTSSRDLGVDPNTLDTTPPLITTSLPVFPCEGLFLVNKEYELAEAGLSDKVSYHGIPIVSFSKADYVELRLTDLYPTLAYTGVVDDSQDFYDSVLLVYSAYLTTQLHIPDTNDLNNKEYPFEEDDKVLFLSDKELIEYLGMTDEEALLFEKYNELARKESFATVEDLKNVEAGMKLTNDNRFCWAAFSCICIIAVGYTSNMYETAMFCRNRAQQAASDYFPGYSSGDRGDALKHITVSMLLRRYLSLYRSYLIMDVVYEGITNQNEDPRDTFMDIHNNRIGRETKYWQFRGSYFDDMNNIQAWIFRIYNYITTSSNGVHKNWTSSANFWTVYWDHICTSKTKYIYYSYYNQN
ncbi:MAG: hypothetical protein IJL44_07140 [Bacteroidales bacterium]|nr:hypothetical protein [Bacteroidales bacterium]